MYAVDGVSGVRNINPGWPVDTRKGQDDKKKSKQQSEEERKDNEEDNPNSSSNHIDEFI